MKQVEQNISRSKSGKEIDNSYNLSYSGDLEQAESFGEKSIDFEIVRKEVYLQFVE